jgi:hypothetical protein
MHDSPTVTRTMRRKRPLLAAIMLHGCRGFVSHTSRSCIQRTRTLTFTLPKEPSPSGHDQYERNEDSEWVLLDDSSVDSKSRVVTTTSNRSNALHSESNTRTNGNKQTLLFADANVAVPHFHEPLPVPLEDVLPLDLLHRNEDVNAILKASELAANEAEAAIPPELKEHLELSTIPSTSRTTEMVDSLPDILTAASVVGEPVTSTKVQHPDISKILKFAIPAIGVWLCGPLLSLIDTSAVGLFSGTVQQAALNPAVAVTDYSALLIVRSWVSWYWKQHLPYHSSSHFF